MKNHGGLSRFLSLLLLRCTNDYLDPGCRPSNDTPLTWATLGNIGLFHQDGRPLDRSARVLCSQGASGVEAASVNPHGLTAVVVGEGTLRVVQGSARNLYDCGINSIILRNCSLPLRVQVEARGCDPIDLLWSWDDNYRFGPRSDISFHVPVRMRCDPLPDAGADPLCAHPEDRSGELGLAQIALFDMNDRALDRLATVTCAQGSSAERQATAFGTARLLPDGRFEADTLGPRNLYLCGGPSTFRPCSDPLRVRVTAPGCQASDVQWTWDQSYTLFRNADGGFRLPVRLQCAPTSVDAGSDAMTDAPTSDIQ